MSARAKWVQGALVSSLLAQGVACGTNGDATSDEGIAQKAADEPARRSPERGRSDAGQSEPGPRDAPEGPGPVLGGSELPSGDGPGTGGAPSQPAPSAGPGRPASDPAVASYAGSSCAGFVLDEQPTASVDANCDANTPEVCPDGSHIDFVGGEPCAVCVVDSEDNRTCDWASRCFDPFLQYLALASGARACDTDSDCVPLTIEASCGPTVTLALRGLIDEEIPWVAELYDAQNCSACGDSKGARATRAEGIEAWCNAGTCELSTASDPSGGSGDAGVATQCWFEFLGDWMRCEESFSSAAEPAGELAPDCAAACLSDPDCVSFYDYGYLDVGLPCYLHRGRCTAGPGVSHEVTVQLWTSGSAGAFGAA